MRRVKKVRRPGRPGAPVLVDGNGKVIHGDKRKFSNWAVLERHHKGDDPEAPAVIQKIDLRAHYQRVLTHNMKVLGWNLQTLAARSGVSVGTIRGILTADQVATRALGRIMRAFDAAAAAGEGKAS